MSSQPGLPQSPCGFTEGYGQGGWTVTFPATAQQWVGLRVLLWVVFVRIPRREHLQKWTTPLDFLPAYQNTCTRPSFIRTTFSLIHIYGRRCHLTPGSLTSIIQEDWWGQGRAAPQKGRGSGLERGQEKSWKVLRGAWTPLESQAVARTAGLAGDLAGEMAFSVFFFFFMHHPDPIG